jgi:NADPH:quinone reductase
MRAIEVSGFGGPEVLTLAEFPDLVPGPGEVVISVAAADVLFLDTVIRSGLAAQWFPVTPPYVPGGGVGGLVTSAGEGVPAEWVGRPVIAQVGSQGSGGGYAEQAVATAGRLIPVPAGVDVRSATALLHDGATALGLAVSTGIKQGEWVLVLGAAGGLGTILVQLARSSGARVVGAARGPAKLAVLRELGADAVVDYSEPGWSNQVTELTAGAGPDVIFDGVGGELGREAFGIIAAGGRFSGHGAPSGGFAEIDPREAANRGVSVRGIEQVQFQPSEHAQFARRALAELSAGRITPVIGQSFRLEDAAAAHAGIEARSSIGKTLLTAG